LAIADGNPVLGRLPRIRVTYSIDDQVAEFSDLTLPHRGFDGHVRAGRTVDGRPVTEDPAYRAARDATPANAWGLLNLSPVSLVFGSWDATRKAHQGRWPAALTGETVGVLTDQDLSPTDLGKGGARVDPVGMSFTLSKEAKQQIADRQKAELSDATYQAFLDAKGKPSVLGLGGIPPTLGQLGLVSCRQIIRSRVLSFATLRQVRFGRGAEGDAAVRSVLAALAINGVVRADAELFLRAHCHLVEAGPTITEIDQRQGRTVAVELPSFDQVDDLLAQAIDHATRVAGLDWTGQVFEVQGDPAIVAAAIDDSDGGGN